MYDSNVFKTGGHRFGSRRGDPRKDLSAAHHCDLLDVKLRRSLSDLPDRRQSEATMFFPVYKANSYGLIKPYPSLSFVEYNSSKKLYFTPLVYFLAGHYLDP